MVREIVKIMLVLFLIFFVNVRGVRAEEEIIFYEVQCGEPAGENEYCKVAPEVVIKRSDDIATVKYQLCFPDGKVLEGEISETENELSISPDLLKDGEHTLIIWAENEDGKIEESETQKIIKVDRQPPEEVQFVYKKEEESPLCFSEETVIEIKANDMTSGVAGIYYQIGEGEQQFMKGNHVFVFIPLEFKGTVKAYAVDKAGNIGAVYESKEIICENCLPEIMWYSPKGLEKWHNTNIPVEISVAEQNIVSGIRNIKWYLNGNLLGEKQYQKGSTHEEKILLETEGSCELEIRVEDYAGNYVSRKQRILFDQQRPEIEVEGIEDYLISSEKREFICRVKDDKKVDSIRGEIIREDAFGNKKTEKISDWVRDGEEYIFEGVLKQDGIYQIKFEIIDCAGNKETKSLQVIIDQTNPVITQVEEWDGKYLQMFVWDYDMKELISDLTSYTYKLMLDGKNFYTNEKCITNGKHIVELQVEDAAGNISKAVAEFIIDRTAPVICLEGAEEGKVYEGQVTLKIGLEEEDSITEVRIDGEAYGENNHYLIDEVGEHFVEVTACDLAGNVTKKEIRFRIKEKETLLEQIIDRTQNKETTFVKNKKENTFMGKWILITVCGISLVGIISYCIMKRKKTL